MLCILLYGVTVLLTCYVLLDLTWRLWKRRLSFIPSIPNVPWLGSTPYIPKDQVMRNKFRLLNMEKYDRLYTVWCLAEPYVMTGIIEYIEPLLKSKSHTKTTFNDYLAEWLGHGLLVSSGEKWKKRRVALTGAFHFNILNDFVDVYEKHARNLVEKLKNGSGNEKVVDIQKLLGLSMLDVICETSMGVSVNALNSTDSQYARAVNDVQKLLFKRLKSIFGRSKILYPYTNDGKKFNECLKILHGYTINVINENIALRLKATDRRNTETDNVNVPYRQKKKVFIDILLDMYEKGEIDVEGIREEVDTFMFAGHDTSSSGLSWIIYEIGRHPCIQQKVQEEIDEISSQECSLADKIRLLKYTECVVKECLRLHPPVSSIARKLKKDTVINDRIFPSNTNFIVDILAVHLNPEYWDDPYVFNPSRFEVEIKRHPLCYMPFSAGARSCIGQKFAFREIMTFLYVILSNYNLRSTQLPDELEVVNNIVVQSLNGINIEFTRRDSKIQIETLP